MTQGPVTSMTQKQVVVMDTFDLMSEPILLYFNVSKQLYPVLLLLPEYL